jgi:hypothetical protein
MPQPSFKGKEALNHKNMSCTGSTKPLAMTMKKNYEFRSKLHNFLSSKEFTMNF